ncbi:MAG: hypothetical protein J7501_06260 [Bdellovibrio sp.]|nr:hypothetical protein [Bdellovibrio sp.]
MKIKFVLSSVLASLVCFSTGARAQDQVPEMQPVITMPLEESTVKKGFFDLYSESSYYYDYDFVTDTRLRYYQPLTEVVSMAVSTYIGAGIQYQSMGAREKYYDDTVNPHLGLQLQILPGVKLQGQIGYRTVMGLNDETSSTTWDPRMIFAAGNLWNWGATQNFTEGYGEVTYVPRLSSTPVSVVWIKQGYRWIPASLVKLDAYGEMYARESRSDDLGPTITEWRMGARSTWDYKKWSVSALVFHAFNREVPKGEIEGLFTVGGNF